MEHKARSVKGVLFISFIPECAGDNQPPAGKLDPTRHANLVIWVGPDKAVGQRHRSGAVGKK